MKCQRVLIKHLTALLCNPYIYYGFVLDYFSAVKISVKAGDSFFLFKEFLNNVHSLVWGFNPYSEPEQTPKLTKKHHQIHKICVITLLLQ